MESNLMILNNVEKVNFQRSYQFQRKNDIYFTGIKRMIWFDDLQCRSFSCCMSARNRTDGDIRLNRGRRVRVGE